MTTGAQAACNPSPPQSGTSTICSGANGSLTASATGSSVDVLAGASLTASGADAAAFTATSTGSNPYGSLISLTVDGLVDGAGATGVLVTNGAPGTFTYPATRLDITVGASGRVTGAVPLALRQSPGNAFGNAVATLDNAGTILSSSGGPAIVTDNADTTFFFSIVNRQSGTIGAIQTPYGTVDNAGTIDGGAISALTTGTDNRGTIRNASAAATITPQGGASIVNSGTIVNAGTGRAIDTAADLTLENRSGALIASGDTLAVRSGGSLALVNRGTIDGSVTAIGSSRIDTTGGLIAGDLRLGDGDDRVAASLDLATGRVAEILGTIDAGGGTNTADYVVASGGAIDGLAATAGFQRVQFTLRNDAELTLSSSPGYGIALAGQGGLTTNGSIVTSGPLLTFPDRFDGAIRFTNLGDIVSTLSQPSDYAFNSSGMTSFINRGSITAIGGNAVDASRPSYSVEDPGVVNEGTISASGVAVSVSGQTLSNSGTIRSSGGTAAIVDLGGGQIRTRISTNSGTIEGVTAGVQASAITLVNTGTIRATAGLGISPGDYVTIDNRAGGVIGGTTAAIGYDGGRFGFRAIIINAGTIDGDVRLLRTDSNGNDTSDDTYADAGGTIDGSLLLGGGDDLVFADFARVMDGRIAGISGTVDGGDGVDKIRLRVRGDLTTAIMPIPGFEGIGYELQDGAALTLISARPLTTTLDLTGQGSVDLTADIATTNDAAISLTGVTLEQLVATTFPDGTPSAVSVVSHGALSYTLTSSASFFAGVVVGGGSNFENAGTLKVTSGPDVNARAIGLYSAGFPYGGATTINNSGTINLDGATGIGGDAYSEVTVINSGRIVQAAGNSAAGIGIAGGFDITNSGTIETAGTAIVATGGFATLANSGRIASTGAEAFRSVYGTALISNAAGGTIGGGNGVSINTFGRTVIANAGAIEGDVRLGRDFVYGGGSAYIAEGGSLTGNLFFGSGDDVLLVRDGVTGITGTIDAGDGDDRYGASFVTSGSATVGGPLPATFEGDAVEAIGHDTTVVLNGPAGGLATGLTLFGDGTFVNRADISASRDSSYDVSLGTDLSGRVQDSAPAGFINEATISTGVMGFARSFANSGTMGTATRANSVYLNATGDEAFSFANSGTIIGTGETPDGTFATVSLYQGRPEEGDAPSAFIANQGQIGGGLYANMQSSTLSFTNSGTITLDGLYDTTVTLSNSTQAGQSNIIDNSGTIAATGPAQTALVVQASTFDEALPVTTITNSGTIAARRAGILPSDGTGLAALSAGLLFAGDGGSTVSIVNAAGGTIAAPAQAGTALAVPLAALDLVNAGTISGGAGTTLATGAPVRVAGSLLTATDGFVAGAIQTGEAGDHIRNSGAITGSIDLGAGDDMIENDGVIDGDVYLRAGNDRFVQRAGALVTGVIDGGDGLDALVIDAGGGGTVSAMRYADFENITQTGSGSVGYSGAFAVDTIRLAGGTATIAPDTSISTSGPITFSGSDGNETIVNGGTIAGGVALAGGDDSVVNRGRILGAVTLGTGADSYTEGAGSTAAGVDGGDGIDTYIADLAGDRAGLAARTGFERLGITGSGTLTLALDQAWDTISLAGTGLALDPAGFSTTRILGGDGSETVSVGGDTPSVALGAGDDRLALSSARLAGSYDGGSGIDSLTLAAGGPITLAGTVTGFETIALAGGRLDVAGTLGASTDAISFDDGADTLEILAGGRVSGSVSLGGGADVFRLAAGGVLDRTISGGEGRDRAVLDLSRDLAIDGDRLQQFESLEAGGNGTLRLTGGAARFDTVTLGDNDLTIDAGATLAAGTTTFGSGTSRLTVAGTLGGAASLGGGDDLLRLIGSPTLNGSIDGGSGSDRVELAVSGSDAAPTALGTAPLVNFETLAVQSGVASIAGSYDFGAVAVSGGRLIGLAGSRLAAAAITVANGATFGSAGTVIGNVAVAGTLSPGASPGTMTVTGNVMLAAGSTTLFEFTPLVSDQLIVSGAVTIASGATLSLVGTRPLTPGVSLDLIVAGGGIDGAYTNVNQAASVGGFLSQSANRLQLLGTFRSDAAFSPQVRATIAYVNGLLVSGQGGSALVAAVPALLGPGGTSNPAAFRRLSPEAYASASQLGTENGLTIIEAARAQSRTTAAPGLFTFGQALTNQRTILGDATQGTATARLQTYGGMGGIGIAAERGWIGAFVGYLDGRQQLRALDARTHADGVMAGVQGEASFGRFSLGALVGYDGGKATTRRALPGGTNAAGRYDLHSWIGDLTAHYTTTLGGWAVQPRAGLSYIRTTRGGVAESGAGPFLLDVTRDRAERWFVSGDVAVIGGRRAGDRVHPYVSLGIRRSIDGRDSQATVASRDAGTAFTLPGVERDRTVATAGAGLGLDVSDRISLFGTYSGEFSDAVRHNGLIGVRFRL